MTFKKYMTKTFTEPDRDKGYTRSDMENAFNASVKTVDLNALVMVSDFNEKFFTTFEVVEYLAEQRSICSKKTDDLKLMREIIFAPMPNEFNKRCGM